MSGGLLVFDRSPLIQALEFGQKSGQLKGFLNDVEEQGASITSQVAHKFHNALRLADLQIATEEGMGVISLELAFTTSSTEQAIGRIKAEGLVALFKNGWIRIHNLTKNEAVQRELLNKLRVSAKKPWFGLSHFERERQNFDALAERVKFREDLYGRFIDGAWQEKWYSTLHLSLACFGKMRKQPLVIKDMLEIIEFLNSNKKIDGHELAKKLFPEDVRGQELFLIDFKNDAEMILASLRKSVKKNDLSEVVQRLVTHFSINLTVDDMVRLEDECRLEELCVGETPDYLLAELRTVIPSRSSVFELSKAKYAIRELVKGRMSLADWRLIMSFPYEYWAGSFRWEKLSLEKALEILADTNICPEALSEFESVLFSRLAPKEWWENPIQLRNEFRLLYDCESEREESHFQELDKKFKVRIKKKRAK